MISRGKTTNEAIAAALKMMNRKKEEVKIEILANETKGLWGIGAKPAVVRVSLRDTPETPVEDTPSTPALPGRERAPKPAVQASETDLDGKVWVKNGQIGCKDAPDKFPLISPGKGVKLFKNEEWVQETVILRESDRLRVELQQESVEAEWELQLSEDRMEARLRVAPGYRIERRLRDQRPSEYLTIELEEAVKPLFVDSDAVMKKLGELGIDYGVDYAEIARACTTSEKGTFVIAKGTPPTPGKLGYFESYHNIEVKKGPKERSNGTVDHREIMEFPSVKRGQIIGRLVPPVPGTYGTTVTNEPVWPADVPPVRILPGRGVIWVDGTKAVAVESGQPQVRTTANGIQISVLPKLTISSDVNLEVGNIHYHGDVEIGGSVQDQMLVEAHGRVMVVGNVNSAQIKAGSSIVVGRNIIGSELSAGTGNMFLAEIHDLLGGLLPDMRHMEEAIRQLQAAPAFKSSTLARTGLGPMIKILCEGRFKKFPGTLKQLIQTIDRGGGILDAQWQAYRQQLYRGFLLNHPDSFQTLEDFSQLVRQTEQLHALSEGSEYDLECFIRTGYVQNSLLHCSGDIIVAKSGVYHSKLRAGGFIEITGIVRGGEIHSLKSVVVEEAGSKGAIHTKITVPADGSIKIGKAMEETVILIGNVMHKFMNASSNVYARLDHTGTLILH